MLMPETSSPSHRTSRVQAPPLLAPGSDLAGYRIKELVGRGGMGEVYSAQQVSMDREVALKVLAPKLAHKDPSFAKRFVDEARAAGKLNHPNIIHVHDVGTADLPSAGTAMGQVHYFSMELVDGESLHDIIKREGRLPAGQLARVMTDVVEALRYAAECGIVHRDIKPDNIMITKAGQVKVADLGLAIPNQNPDDHAPERDEQGRARVMGTPLYLSPEQARAQPVDFRSDQYSLGATLFHLLTGEPPYRGPDAKTVMKAHVLEAVPDPAQRATDVPEVWRQLCVRLMQKRPEQRFTTADDLVDAVEAACKGVTLERFERKKRGFQLPKQSATWIIFVAVGVVVVLIVLWLLSAGRSAAPNQPGDAPAASTATTTVTTVVGVPVTKPQLPVQPPPPPKSVVETPSVAAPPAPAPEPVAKTPVPEVAPKAVPPAVVEVWLPFAQKLQRIRTTLAYQEVTKLVDHGGGLPDDERQRIAALADVGRYGQIGEGAMRAYISALAPRSKFSNGTEAILIKLSRAEVSYRPVDDRAETTLTMPRSEASLPWAELLNAALADQATDHQPLVRAATLWMWKQSEATAAIEAIADTDLGRAMSYIETRIR